MPQAEVPLDHLDSMRDALETSTELHDYCNVICSPFSQQGGTWPTSMTSAFKTYTWPPASVANFIAAIRTITTTTTNPWQPR
jgi:hypothetical protein